MYATHYDNQALDGFVIYVLFLCQWRLTKQKRYVILKKMYIKSNIKNINFQPMTSDIKFNISVVLPRVFLIGSYFIFKKRSKV